MPRDWIDCLVVGIAIIIIIAFTWFALVTVSPARNYLAADKYAPYDNDLALRAEFAGHAGTLPPAGCTEGFPCNERLVSCCGDADIYEADDFETDKDGRLIAILTCDDPRNCEEVPNKIVRAPGSKFLVTRDVMLVPGKPLNKTKHGWVFIGASGGVICYSLPPGS